MPLARRLVAVPAALLVAAGCSATPDEPEATGPQTSATSSATEPAAAEPTAQPTEQPTGAATDGGSAAADDAARTARGELVEGFPTDVVPVPEDASITLSTLVREGDVLAVSVAGETPAGAEAVLGDARRRLRGQGFEEADAPQPEGGSAATFVRSGGAETINVTVLREDGVSRFTIGGQLTTD